MRSKSCPFCRGSLKKVHSGDLWVLTNESDSVDLITLAKENLRCFYLYIESLPFVVPDTHFLLYEYLIWMNRSLKGWFQKGRVFTFQNVVHLLFADYCIVYLYLANLYVIKATFDSAFFWDPSIVMEMVKDCSFSFLYGVHKSMEMEKKWPYFMFWSSIGLISYF